jgi:hypothetical protein
MRLLPGYEMASNAQPYIVKTTHFYTARMGRGLQKIMEIRAFFLDIAKYALPFNFNR